jgi:hypothetical protein
VWVRDDALVEHYNAAYHALGGARPDRGVLRVVPDGSGTFDFEHVARALEPEFETLLDQCY